MNHYVYEITNLVNGKKYIGKRSCHCSIQDDKYMGSGNLIVKAIKKYGVENFKKDILQICENEDMAYEWEKVYIEQVRAYDNSNYYNIAFGGCGFSSCQVKNMWKNDEHRSKMIQTIKNTWKNDEYKAKMSRVSSETMKKTIKKLWQDESYIELQRKKFSKESKMRWANEDYRNRQINVVKKMWKDEHTRKRIISSMKIRFSTEENKKKRSEASKRRFDNNDVRKQYSINLTNRWKDPNFREYMSNTMKDKFKDESYVEKMSFNWKEHEKEVVLLNDGKVFNSMTEASEYVGLKTQSTITLCCQGKRLSAGKIDGKNAVWMYYDDYIKSDEKYIKEKLANGDKSRNNSNSNLKDNSRKVVCLNTGIVFNSLNSAREAAGLKCGWSIGKCCLGKAKSAGKINGEPARWMYYDDYIKLNSD